MSDVVAYTLTEIAREFKVPVLIGFDRRASSYVYRETPTGFFYPVDLGQGVRLSSLSAVMPDIERALNRRLARTDLRLTLQPTPPIIELHKPTSVPIHVTDEMLRRLPIGCSVVGQRFLVDETVTLGLDLSNTETPHILVAGMTGSGKSVAIQTILLGLCYSTPPSQLRIFAIDMKNRGLGFLKGFPHLVDDRIATTTDDARRVVERVSRILSSRKESGESAPTIVLAIDEIGEFSVQGIGDLLTKELLQIGRQGRELRVHLIVSVHRPDSSTIGSDLLSQFGLRVVGRLRNARESTFVLGDSDAGAEKLVGRGSMIFSKSGSVPQRVQVFLPTPTTGDLARRRWELVSIPSIISPTPVTDEARQASEESPKIVGESAERRERERRNPDVEAVRPVVEEYVTFKTDGSFIVRRGGWTRLAEALGSAPGGSTQTRTIEALKALAKEKHHEDRALGTTDVSS